MATTYWRNMEGIVFDKDGTLTDFAASWGPLNRAAAEYAGRGDPSLARRLLDVGGDDGSGQAYGGSLLAACSTREIALGWVEAGADFEPSELEEALDDIYSSGAEYAVPVTAIDGLFGRLRRRGLRVGVATSDSERSARATLAGLGVEATHLFIAGYDSGYGPKPEPGMVRAFCRHFSLSPACVAVVGDNLHDIRMGRSAGCRICMGVLTGTGTRDELASEADWVLDGIADLEALLDTATGPGGSAAV